MRIHIEITGRCNLRCTYCYNSCFNKKEILNKEVKPFEWKKIIDEANKIGCERFTISGGEPLLVEEIFDLIERCKSPVILFTNATLIISKNLKKFNKLKYLKAFRISVDGIEAHNKYRPPSFSEDIFDKIKLIKKESKINVGVTSQFSKELIKELINFYHKLKDLKIDNWRIDIPFFSGRYVENKNIFNQASFKEIILACRSLIQAYLTDRKPFDLAIANIYNSKLTNYKDYHNFDSEQHPCCRTDIVSIRPNGDISVCAAYNFFLSNVKEEGTLKRAIQKAQKNNFYKIKISDIKECIDCRYLKLCGTGCRADATFLTKSDLSLDPICCSLWPLLEKYIIPLLSDREKNGIYNLINMDGSKPKTFSGLEEIINFYYKTHEKKNLNRG